MAIPVEITQDLTEGQVWLDSTRKSSLRRNGNKLTAAFFETGIVLVIRRQRFEQNYFLNFEIYIPKDEFSMKTRGLLGNLDRDPTNDLKRRNSQTPLPNELNDRQLYDHLLTCKNYHDIVHEVHNMILLGQVPRQQDSLFSGSVMGRRKRQMDEEFIPVFIDEFTFTDDQIVACEGHQECLFDLAVTGSMEFANTTLMDDRDANQTKEVLGK